MKLLILGYGESGKDHAAEYLHKNTGLTFSSSSEFAAERFLYSKLALKYGYRSFRECYLDRRNRRQEWKEEISAYNVPKTRLAEEIYAKYDMYVGMRCRDEVRAVKAKFPDLVAIWIDASERVPVEVGSCTTDSDQAHIIIPNNGTVSQFEHRLDKFIQVYRNLPDNL